MPLHVPPEPGELVSVGWIPRGDLGTAATLGHMRELVNRGLTVPLTIQVASDIVSGTLGSGVRMAGALRGWTAAHFRFQADPVGVELLRTVPEMLRDIVRRGVVQADCDDAAVLSAALGKAVGMRARFIVLAFGGPGSPFAHVYTELWTGEGWANMDVTRPPHPAPPTRAAYVEV